MRIRPNDSASFTLLIRAARSMLPGTAIKSIRRRPTAIPNACASISMEPKDATKLTAIACTSLLDQIMQSGLRTNGRNTKSGGRYYALPSRGAALAGTAIGVATSTPNRDSRLRVVVPWPATLGHREVRKTSAPLPSPNWARFPIAPHSP